MSQVFPIEGKRIFVAGHRGMLGRAIVKSVENQGGVVVAAPRDALDLRHREATAKWIGEQKPDAVVMAAARVGGIADNIAAQAEMCADNLAIALSTIDGAHRADVQRFLYVASSAVYPQAARQPLVEVDLENGAPDPSHQGYAAAKHAGIALCRAYADQHGRDYFAALPTNLFGPTNASGERAHVIPSLLHRFLHAVQTDQPEIEIWGTGRPKRDFLHVDDCAQALGFILRRQSGFRAINVGSGHEVTIQELAQILAKIAGFSGKLVFDSTRPDGAPRRALDISALKALGWAGPRNFENQLAAVYDEIHKARTAR